MLYYYARKWCFESEKCNNTTVENIKKKPVKPWAIRVSIKKDWLNSDFDKIPNYKHQKTIKVFEICYLSFEILII